MQKVILFFMIIFSFSCSQPECPENQVNPILAEASVQSAKYQKELRKLILNDNVKVVYYFNRREEKHLIIDCYGSGYCGELMVFVENEDEQTNKLQNEKGYSGARLQGLQLEENEDKTTILYRGLEVIID